MKASGTMNNLSMLKARAGVLAGIREYFAGQGFLEVETPIRVTCPAVEPYLHAFESGGLFLRTSPELHMKKILVEGGERIFEMGRVFRKEEQGRHHLEEFTMLEWYRAHASLDRLMLDCEDLIEALCTIAGRPKPARPYPRLKYGDLFADLVGLDPNGTFTDEQSLLTLKAAARGQGYEPGDDAKPEDLLQVLYTNKIEPALKSMGAVFVTEFPARSAVLATIDANRTPPVANRFELYLDGIEIANAYHELTDPEENLRRVDACNAVRRETGFGPYPLDEDFIRALRKGMPPSAGIALGVERLLMWLLGKDTVGDVFFPGRGPRHLP